MSEPKRIEYEGPLATIFYSDEWGVICLGDGSLLAERIMQELGVSKDYYQNDETTITNVRIVVEVLDGTLVRESDLRKVRLALGLRQSEPIPPPIDFDPPSAPESPDPPPAPEVPCSTTDDTR